MKLFCQHIQQLTVGNDHPAWPVQVRSSLTQQQCQEAPSCVSDAPSSRPSHSHHHGPHTGHRNLAGCHAHDSHPDSHVRVHKSMFLTAAVDSSKQSAKTSNRKEEAGKEAQQSQQLYTLVQLQPQRRLIMVTFWCLQA